MENLQLVHHSVFSLANYKGIIFDLDGTLYDRRCFSMFMALHSIVSANPLLSLRARVLHNKFKGTDLKQQEAWERAYFRLLAAKSGQSAMFVEQWYRKWNCQLLEKILRRHYKLRPGVNQALQELKNAGISLALLSDYPNVEGRMQALGLDRESFSFVASTIDFGAQKPAPRPFHEIAERLGFSSKEILVVGDKTDADGLGAERSGKDFFLLKNAANWQFFLDGIKKLRNREDD